MKNIDVIRELIGSMDGLDERNEAIRYGIYAILEKIEAPETKRGRPSKAKKPFDIGKAKACRDAGWSIAKIADEMGVSPSTVSRELKEAQKEPERKRTKIYD